jgi:putative SOS response-associated peptidase YedK
MALAGIWDRWRGPGGEVIRSFAITTTANQLLAPIHNRMPVIIAEADWAAWLGETEADPVTLLHPLPEDVLRLWPVGRSLNSVRNDGPELLAESTEQDS